MRSRFFNSFLFAVFAFGFATQPIAKELSDKEKADLGYSFSIGREGVEILKDLRALNKSLSQLKDQNPKTSDVYILVAALDSDPVFGREAKESAKLLQKRYNADGRTIVLGYGIDKDTPQGSPENLAAAFARIGELIDAENDILIVYLTSHGNPDAGLVHKYSNIASAMMGTKRLQKMLEMAKAKKRLIMISACFSGAFVPVLGNDDTIIMSAAAKDKTSFGCQADNDWTFFGDALINQAMRGKNHTLFSFRMAKSSIKSWEKLAKVVPSNPQIHIGKNTDWVNALDEKIPENLGEPVGKSAYSPK